ncbi:hypothetical protein BX616_001588 [Lobosporangium transversale]|nr:hypothetical protein BX616_001588 [Lobosporangium transversale]
MSIVETFHGYVETTQDTLLIFEACRRGLLPRICRRLQEKERRIVQSGTVFVFDERESGIKRWTDGLIWSPSRILGNFLVYRELDKRSNGRKDTPPSERASRSSPSDIESAVEKSKERALVGSLTNSYHFKKNGLIKKTMSIVVNGVPQHMISYYSREDVLGGRLRTPSSVPELVGLEISPEFLIKQNFRIPPTVEQPYELLNKPGSSAQNQHSRPVSGSFEHTVGPNNDFSPVTFGHNNLNLRIETDITESSAMSPLSKSYHQQSTHSVHSQQGAYQSIQSHLGGAHQQHRHHLQQQSQRHTQHPYNSTSYFSANAGYNSASNSNSSSSALPESPSSLRYMSRSQELLTYSGQSPSSQPSGSPQQGPTYHHHHQQQQSPHIMSHQRHLSSSQYNGGSPGPMMPASPTTPGPNPQDFGLTMGYQSPVPTSGANTFGGAPSDINNNHSQMPQQPQHTHQQQQHHQHYQNTQPPPSTQGWSDFNYPSYSTTTAPASLGPTMDHPSQQRGPRNDSS